MVSSVLGLGAVLLIAGVGLVHLTSPPPKPTTALLAPRRLDAEVAEVAEVADPDPALPWPSVGQAALGVPAAGLEVRSGPETPVPVASLTKIMTGYLILHDHPLPASGNGPTIVMTAADVVSEEDDAAQGGTTIEFLPGEKLTERQLLNGLLVRSANNFADTLARWDAGSVPAFVAKMNATAAELGLHDTHFADANGLSAGSVSTAGDILRLAELAMETSVFPAVVDQRSVTLPGTAALPGYVPSLGTDGIVGVKSGFTQASMGCMVLASRRVVDGRTVMVYAAVTGAPGWEPLETADAEARALVDAASADLRVETVVPDRAEVAQVRTAWAPPIPVRASRSVSLLLWPGDVVHWRLEDHSGPGDEVGTLTVTDRDETGSVVVDETRSPGGPSLGWRLWH